MKLEEDAGVRQLKVWNNTGVTWVPGVRGLKIRGGRYWLKILAGPQNVKFYWGANPRKTWAEDRDRR